MTAALALGLGLALALSPFTKEEEHVREGNEALLAREPARALERYDAAERAVGERAEIDFDRAHAARTLGRGEEAAAWLRRAAERGDPRLASRALQNLGHGLAGAGDRDGAIAAYADALRKDPANEDARHDLEVLLRWKEEEERRRGPGDGGERQGAPGAPEPSGPPAAPEPGPDPARRERPSPSGGERDEGSPEPRPGGAPRREEGAGEAAAPAPTRAEAEKLLDALRAQEQKLPLAGRERKGGRRADAAKDW